MFKRKDRKLATAKRHLRVRKKVSGTAEVPRLSVARTLRHVYAQVIDDATGTTLASASNAESAIRNQTKDISKTEAARAVGKVIGERALARGIERVVFDRGGKLFHGRVAAVAEGARQSGLEFQARPGGCVKRQ